MKQNAYVSTKFSAAIHGHGLYFGFLVVIDDGDLSQTHGSFYCVHSMHKCKKTVNIHSNSRFEGEQKGREERTRKMLNEHTGF